MKNLLPSLKEIYYDTYTTPPHKRTNIQNLSCLTAIALAITLSFNATAATTDYSGQTLDHGIDVIDQGNAIVADNLIITGSSLVDASDRNEGIYIGAGSTGTFGGDRLEVRFDTDDATHEFAGIQINGQTTGNASAVFDSDQTVIVVSGPGNSLKWGFGLLVNGAGTNTASARFTGGDVFISTTTEDYTAQSTTVKANATLDFSNNGNVEIHAYSPFGVTVVDAQGQLTFNNNGNVLLKGEIQPGTHTAQTNVVGIQGYDGVWNATSAVKELRIELSGAGVDNDGTSYSTGTKGIDLSGENGSFTVNSNSFVINMDIDPDMIDDSPEGHTAQNAYGISIDTYAKLVVGVNTATSITVNEGLGTAYGINAGYGADVRFDGNVSIQVDGATSSVAVNIEGEDAYSKETVKPIAPTSITFGGAQNHFTGDVIASNQGSLNLESGHTVVNGNINTDETSSISLQTAALELAQGSTMSVNGSLISSNGQIVLNDAAENTVSIKTLSTDSSLQVIAAAELNDKLGGDISTFGKAVSIGEGAQGTQIVMQEGLVAGETTGTLLADGTLDASSVQHKTNSVMQSSLELSANLPLVMSRILTNDVRKRLGNLRASENASGAWVRYDGGRLSGSNGLDTDFTTVQVGIDTKLSAESARLGVAFSYTNGDTDYARGGADLEGYSLAGYGTWFADNGMYVDVIGRLATMKNDITAGSASGKMENLLLGLSAEAGWKFDLTNLVYIEPQAELSYAYVKGDDFNIGNATYKIDSMDSLIGRVGFAAGLSCPNNRGDVYVRASAVHEFLGDAEISGRTTGSTGVYSTDGEDTWVEFGLGGNFNISKSTYVWADVERTAGATLDEDWRATLGVRYSW